MKNFNWKDLLREHALFSNLDPKEVERIIAQLLDDKVSDEREFAEGKNVFKEGELGDSVFLVGRGSVQVVLEGDNGSGTPISTLRQGEFFGEMALLEKKPRAATVKAKESCTLLEIKGQEFLKLLDEHKDVESKMLLKLSERLRHANDQILAVRVRGVDDKLERFNQKVDAELKEIGASVTEVRAMTDHTKARADDIISSFERTRTWLTWILYFVVSIVTLGGLAGGGYMYWIFKDTERLHKAAKDSVTQIQTFEQQIGTIRDNIAENLVMPIFRNALGKGVTDAVSAYEQFVNIQPHPKFVKFFIPLLEIQHVLVSDKSPRDYTELLKKILADARDADKAADVIQAYYLLLTNEILVKNETFLGDETFKSTFSALEKYMKDNRDRVKPNEIPTIPTQSFSGLSNLRQEKLRNLNKLIGKH